MTRSRRKIVITIASIIVCYLSNIKEVLPSQTKDLVSKMDVEDHGSRSANAHANSTITQQLILLFITTHMSDQHLWYLNVCWPQVLMASPMLEKADKLVYLNTDAQNRERVIEVSEETFRYQNLTIEEGDNPGLQQGAMAALSEASRLHWFDRYDWVIRLNPDVIIRDSTYLMDAMENDKHASALLINCVGDKNEDGTLKGFVGVTPINGNLVHTDLFAIKPSAMPQDAFLKPSSSNAEQSFTDDLRSIIHNDEHRWIPDADPLAINGKYVCRAGTGRDLQSASTSHFHVGKKAFFDGICPISPVKIRSNR